MQKLICYFNLKTALTLQIDFDLKIKTINQYVTKYYTNYEN